jgi:predicted membrane-bound spermidine synthase
LTEKRTWLYAGVGLLTAAVLMVELLMTRLFSVAMYYHFAFLAVSVSMLGLGLGGLLVYLNRHRFSPERLPAWLNMLGLLLTIFILADLLIVLNLRLPTDFGAGTFVLPVLVFVVGAMPFVFAGALLSLIVWRYAESIHTVYFYDLLGAAAGSLAILPLLEWVGAPNAVLIAATLAAASAAMFSAAGNAKRRAILRGLTVAAGVLLLLVCNLRWNFLDIRYAKGVSTDQELFSRWNAISRICLHQRDGRLRIMIDCEAATWVSYFDFQKSDARLVRADFSRSVDDLAQMLRPNAKTMIIGMGGGWDVARALAHGSPRVVALEINPLIARDLMAVRLRDYNRALLERPEVELILDDARSAIQRTDEKFGVIQSTLIDTWASTAAGAFALTENYLYTVEAFESYLRHLSADGILEVTRFEFVQPRQALRVVSLGRAAFERMGERDVAGRFIVVSEKLYDIRKAAVLIRRTPFTPEETARVRALIAQNPDFQELYLPDAPLPNPFAELLASPRLADFTDRYAFDVSAVPDARPFFFFTTRWSRLPSLFSSEGEDFKNNVALFVLAVLSVLSVFSVLGLFLLPVKFARGTPITGDLSLRWVYFLAIGVAYIVVQVSLIQTFILFLGHPTYGISVVVFSMLVGSGLGSMWSRRLSAPARAAMLVPLALAVALVALQFALLPPMLEHLQFLSRIGRGMVSVAVILPFGFFMGIPFPSGVRAASRSEGDALPWLWSANSGGSVLGSAVAIVLATMLGVPLTGALGGACYLVAGVSAWLTREPAAALAPQPAD